VSAGAAGSSVPRQTLIGGIVGGVVGLLVILALILVLIRRIRPRWLQRSRKRGDTNASPLSPALPIQSSPGMMEAGALTPKPAMSFAEFSLSRENSLQQSIALSAQYTAAYDSRPPSGVPSIASSSNDSTAAMLKKGGPEGPLPPPPPAKTGGAKIPRTPTRPKERPPTLNFALSKRK